MAPEMSPEQVARSEAIWAELVEGCRKGPLPFIKVDNSGQVVCLWDPPSTNNAVDDFVRGIFFCELLVWRAKKSYTRKLVTA
jgi:hypothetical protein